MKLPNDYDDFFGSETETTTDTVTSETPTETYYSEPTSTSSDSKKGGCLIPAIIFFLFLKWVGDRKSVV